MKYSLVALLCLCSALLPTTNFATSSTTIEEVVALGKQPGPRLWRITHEDHELWILGILSPLPQKMAWDTSAVEAVLADAAQFIEPPGVSMSVNPLKAAFVLPSLWRIERNPGNKKLKDLLPPELYARWLALKEIYIGRDRGIEKKRPILAAYELYQSAIEHAGLTQQTGVYKSVRKAVQKNKVPVVTTGITRRIKEPRKTIKKFKKSQIEDIACFEKTLARIETDLAVMESRALAWAAGDVKTLRTLPYDDQNETCFDAVLTSSFATEMSNQLDLVDVQQQLKQKWLHAAETALRDHAVSFATLPIDELLQADGYVAELVARGYQVRGG